MPKTHYWARELTKLGHQGGSIHEIAAVLSMDPNEVQQQFGEEILDGAAFARVDNVCRIWAKARAGNTQAKIWCAKQMDKADTVAPEPNAD